MKYEKVPIGDLCRIERQHVKPKAGTTYALYSLPAFDNERTPERVDGAEIKSSKLAVNDEMILYNKLNVSFKRVWNIRNIKGNNCVCSTEFLPIIIDHNQVTQDFLYYQLISKSLTDAMYGARQGTSCSQQRISENSLLSYKIFCPPLEEQRKIASIMEAIDEKIELNNAINNNLEHQAQAIFENQFLELQMLPEGWQHASLIDIADYLNGLAMQKYRPSDDEIGIPVLKIKELRQGCCDDSSELCSPSIKSEYVIHDGDVIFSWSGSLLVDFWCGGTCGLNQHLFKVTSKKYDKWFYYAWTKHHLDRFIAVAADKATTMGHIKRDELSKAKVLIPTEKDYRRIGGLLQPIYDLIISNRIENKRLAETRDSLLPKLMNGDFDLSGVNL